MTKLVSNHNITKLYWQINRGKFQSSMRNSMSNTAIIKTKISPQGPYRASAQIMDVEINLVHQL